MIRELRKSRATVSGLRPAPCQERGPTVGDIVSATVRPMNLSDFEYRNIAEVRIQR